mgnify:CR=1 FL=1|jgi:small subunit ribosomal protein S13|tara:strand:- start:1764 stop:2231 length:468 start_codon:yes stop_codon:yes gene_type:complete
MSKVNEAELGDDFSYIVRIADTDIDGLRPITYGLASVKGVGIRTSMMICRLSGIDGKRLGGHLTTDEQDQLRKAIDDYATNVPWWMVNRQRDLESNEDAHIIANEVSMTKDDDVSRLAEIKTFRGMRHRSGHKVRGQRLRSNGRRGSALGVERKK